MPSVRRAKAKRAPTLKLEQSPEEAAGLPASTTTDGVIAVTNVDEVKLFGRAPGDGKAPVLRPRVELLP